MDKEFTEYCNIFENLYDIVLVITDHGEIAYANKRARHFYGYTKEQFQRMSIMDIRKDTSSQEIFAQLDTALQGRIEFETEHITRDGSICRVRVKSVSPDFGKGKFTVSFVQDLTDLDALDKKAELFASSLDAAPTPMFMFDQNLIIHMWNKASADCLGYTREEMLGASLRALIPQDKLEELRLIQSILAMGQTVQDFCSRRIHKDGNQIDVVVSYAPFKDSEDHVIGFVGTYQNQTAMESELQLFRKSREFLMESGSFCIWEYDFAQKNLSNYCSLELLLGYEKGTIPDVPSWYSYVHEDDLAMVLDAFNHKLGETGYFNLEYRLRTAKGDYHWISTKSKVLDWSSDHSPLRIMGFHEDIHEKKCTEEELNRKNRELEEMSIRANAASDAKGMFLASMSHEIRTPLNGIISVVELLQNTALSPEQEKLLGLLGSSAAGLDGIVTSILDLTKAETMGVDLKEESFSLKLLIQGLLEELQIRANQKGIAVSFFKDNAIGEQYYGDHRKLAQILRNLISNALKFTERGTISMTIKPGEDQTIIFSLSDTGIGMDETYLHSLFQNYSRAPESEHRYEGTGLGLAISRKYAQAMGGDITCSTKPGVGSTFFFTCRLRPERSCEKLVQEDVPLETLQEDTVEYHVLSVDDNFVNQSVMEYVVAQAGCHFHGAYNGAEAMERLKERNYDMILMDIQLPDTNGYLLTGQIRKQKGYKDIPIVAMTAYAQSEDRDKCLAAGMNEYIAKPIHVEQVKTLIQGLLSPKVK